MAKYNYRCKFCDAGFVREDRYLKHRCKAMERDEEIRTPIGQAAWEYYKLWLTLQRRQAPTVQTFLDSRYYTALVRFAKFAQKTGIPNTEQYIKYMVRSDVSPMLWTNDQMYSDYLQYLDRGRDPMAQVQYTIDYLFKIADALECEVGEIFDHLNADEVIMMLRRRQLTPWILLHSSKFRDFTQKKMTTDQQMVFKTIVKPETWVSRRKDNPDIVATMKEIVRELNL
jgi:hypothetical protein